MEQYDVKKDFTFYDAPLLLSFVPKRIAKKYIRNPKFKDEVLKLWKKKVNPVKYSKDTNLKRKLLLKVMAYRYIKDYKESTWESI